MRAFVVLLLVVIVAFLIGAGVIYFQKHDNGFSVNVDTHKFNTASQATVDETKKLGHEVAEDTRRAAEDIREKVNGSDAQGTKQRQIPTADPGPVTVPAPPATP